MSKSDSCLEKYRRIERISLQSTTTSSDTPSFFAESAWTLSRSYPSRWALQPLQAVWALAKMGSELKDVPETSQVFLEILGQVDRDVKHASQFYSDEIAPHTKSPGLPVNGAVQAVEAAIREREKFGAFGNAVDKIDFPYRVTFVRREYKHLDDKERALRFAHDRLRAAVGSMHVMAAPLGSPRNSYLSSGPAKPLRLGTPPAPPQVRYTEGAESSHPASGSTGGGDKWETGAEEKPGV
ncbi:hypothetical protein F4819DRAFT_178903 [Hypoxylon fuscum]|nr:hypothetical protein F4819DRAFT_178903 [Hypoxylon fuscum]